MFGDDEPRRFFGPSKDGPALGDGSMPAPPRLEDPLNMEQAEQLMSVIGPPQLPDAWKQGIFFAGYQPYGLQQVEGGPCGVLAVVQAFLLRALMTRGLGAGEKAVLEVDEKERQEALADALAEILWRNAGDGKKAIILLPSSSGAAPLNASQLRCLQPATFTSFEQLRAHIMQRPYREAFFTPAGCGLALLLYSIAWTRGCENIKERDADDPKQAVMIGGHGYCTQELVNLMMFGRAYSNVFDGTKRLGSVKDGWCVLQGVPKRPNVGFLSLFEAFKCIEVGPRYKGPSSPVWVVCAESHYSVLFSTDATIDARESEKVVDLFYYDQLARQSERIHITVIPNRLPPRLTTGFEEGESMIDRCIRTKWKDADINWNGSEAIL